MYALILDCRQKCMLKCERYMKYTLYTPVEMQGSETSALLDVKLAAVPLHPYKLAGAFFYAAEKS